jgi:hypothetical protein
MLRFLAALALSVAPAQAQMLDGADDPAFRAALTTLLAKDDPAAVATLRDLAEAGNPAALVTLPFALQWVPPQGNLREKNAQRMVSGVKAQDAAALAHGATALWNGGQDGDPKQMTTRAAALLALGEPEKAATLIATWVNQTAGRGELPPALFTDDMPAMLGGFVLTFRLLNAGLDTFGTPQDEAARLLSLLREDRLAAWIAYTLVLDQQPDLFDTIGNPLAGTGLSAAETEARTQDARAVRAVWRAFVMGATPTPAATARRAREVLQGRADLTPVSRLCQAHCADSIASCEAAVLAYPGLIDPSFSLRQPFANAVDPAEFAASDRGLFTMLRPRKDPAAAADRATAEGLDACYAGILKRRDTLSFGP